MTADRLLLGLKIASALGCGLTAGVLFAFSSFLMNALARLPPAQGIAAMQAINITVVTPSFFGVFFGTDALAAVKPESAEGATLWAAYLSRWTAWNHVRTLAALAAAGMFVIAIWQRPTQMPDALHMLSNME
jgi:uncharacterized membrane protein